jgi:hypothetical protein
MTRQVREMRSTNEKWFMLVSEIINIFELFSFKNEDIIEPFRFVKM